MQRLVLSTLSALIIGVSGYVPEDQRADSVDPEVGRKSRAEWPADVVAHLDSGNVAMREQDPEQALAHYLNAAEKAPDNSTVWFGVFIAHNALGNTAAADSAMAKVRELAPGATLVHPVPDSSGNIDGA
jgi:tetratricopeptide (TPR) repeat protein